MLRNAAGCFGLAPIGVTDFVCGPGFLGTAARDASDRHTHLYKATTKITVSPGEEPYRRFGANPEHPALFRSIRITLRHRCLSEKDRGLRSYSGALCLIPVSDLYFVSSAVAIAPFISGRIVDIFTARREALSTHSVVV